MTAAPSAPIPAADRPLPPGLISVTEAQARVLALAPAPRHETLSLLQGAGRRLAVPVAARRDQPPFDASAMDGYALAVAPQIGDAFTVIGESGAGHGHGGPLGPGQAVRIFTGAPVPPGGSHVVLQEDVTRIGDRIRIDALSSGTNIRRRGQDFPAGQTLGPRRLRPADLALLAAMDVAELTVAARPRVAILSTGDELVMPGEPARDDQIMASNGIALAAMVENAGGKAQLLPIARDSIASLRAVFDLARGADIIVTIGGASVGDHDLVGRVAQDLGLDAAFWKVALRPGKPLMAGQLFGAAFLGLPGNPVSAFVCAELFLLPLIRAALGDPSPLPPPRRAVLGQDLAPNGPRSHYMRARIDPGTGQITPYASQDSALLSVLSEANALLIRPPADPARAAGEIMDYLPL